MAVKAEEFTMWRAVFAFALVDRVLSLEEQKILSHHLRSQNFTQEQYDQLRDDMDAPQDVEVLFSRIQKDELKKRFCELARTLAWSEGDIDRQEKELLRRVSCLKKPENKDFVTNSGSSAWMKDYIAKYEEMAFIQSVEVAPLFDMRA